MTHHVDYDESKYLLLHTDQEASAHKAAELWVDYDMKRLDEMRAIEHRSPDYRASRYGRIGFHHVEPLKPQPTVADTRLDARLNLLCEQLRARY
jgi:hypothetical protein